MDKTPKDQKITNREHYQRVSKIKGSTVPELELPRLPKVYAHVWGWFVELYNGEPITYTEIMNWSQLMRQRIKVSEVRLLRRVESAYTHERHG